MLATRRTNRRSAASRRRFGAHVQSDITSHETGREVFRKDEATGEYTVTLEDVTRIVGSETLDGAKIVDRYTNQHGKVVFSFAAMDRAVAAAQPPRPNRGASFGGPLPTHSRAAVQDGIGHSTSLARATPQGVRSLPAGSSRRIELPNDPGSRGPGRRDGGPRRRGVRSVERHRRLDAPRGDDRTEPAGILRSGTRRRDRPLGDARIGFRASACAGSEHRAPAGVPRARRALESNRPNRSPRRGASPRAARPAHGTAEQPHPSE